MDTLFHYTDLNAFLSIIQSKKLWLTGIHNLNDHQEITWALGKIEKRLNELAVNHGPQKSELIWLLVRGNLGATHVCSLSSESDLLSQWRAYGQNGSGVSIGLNRRLLPRSERLPILTAAIKDTLSLHQVIYDEHVQEQLIDNLLKPVFDRQEIDDQMHTAMAFAASRLAGLSSIFKNAAFHEEKEWRIIHRPFILSKKNSYEAKVKVSASPPKHRVSGGRLITYFEYNFLAEKPAYIFSELVLGPKSEVSDYDLSILLTESGLENINVRRSKASYR